MQWDKVCYKLTRKKKIGDAFLLVELLKEFIWFHEKYANTN